jgi:hypothetical protein
MGDDLLGRRRIGRDNHRREARACDVPAEQTPLGIELAPSCKQRLGDVVTLCRRRDKPTAREAFLNDTQLLRIAPPPAPAGIDNVYCQ